MKTPLSPVEHAISQSDEYKEVLNCKCLNCRIKLSQFSVQLRQRAILVGRAKRAYPGLCVAAMLGGWSIEKFVNEVKKLDTIACSTASI